MIICRTIAIKSTLAYGCLFALLVAGCAKASGGHPATEDSTGTTSSTHADDLPPADNTTPSLTINWDTGAIKISHDVYFAEYPRIHRLGGDTLLLTYHCGPATNTWGNVALRESLDGGVT